MHQVAELRNVPVENVCEGLRVKILRLYGKNCVTCFVSYSTTTYKFITENIACKISVEVGRLFLHGHKVSDISCKITFKLVFLLFSKFAFNELCYCTVLCFSLVIGETAYQPVVTGRWFSFNVTMFLILYYKYDCNTICHKIFIKIHSLVHWLGNHEAIICVTLG